MTEMQLAFSTLACPGWTIEEAGEAARRWGYEGIQLRLIDGEFLRPDLSASERTRVKRALAGLRIACIDTSARFSSGDAAERAANRDDATGFLRLASEMECPLVRVFAGQPFEVAQGEQLEAVVKRVSESLNMLAPMAERYGVDIGLETHDVSARGRTTTAILSAVPSRAVGAVWDVMHPFRCGETPDETLGFLEGRLMFVHVKDARPAAEKWEFTALGDGDVPVERALNVLGAAGWKGWVSVEWEKKWYPEIAEPDEVLPQYAERLRHYLSKTVR